MIKDSTEIVVDDLKDSDEEESKEQKIEPIKEIVKKNDEPKEELKIKEKIIKNDEPKENIESQKPSSNKTSVPPSPIISKIVQESPKEEPKIKKENSLLILRFQLFC